MPKFRIKESKMQADVKGWAEERWGDKQKDAYKRPEIISLVCIKLTMLGMMGQAGWPDLVFFTRTKKFKFHVFFIEMKKKDKVPTPLQALRHEVLRLLGFTVYVADTVESAKLYVSREMQR